jgi:hypothetical protein
MSPRNFGSGLQREAASYPRRNELLKVNISKANLDYILTRFLFVGVSCLLDSVVYRNDLIPERVI